MINNFKQNVNNPKSSIWRLTEVIALIAVFISAITSIQGWHTVQGQHTWNKIYIPARKVS